MQKMVTKAESLYCTFCWLVGHDDKNYRAYDLLQERTYDSYFLKGEDPRITQARPQVVQPAAQVPHTPPPPLQFVPAQPQQNFIA